MIVIIDVVGRRCHRHYYSNNDNDRMAMNTAPVKDFLLKEGKDWSRDFAGKCTRDRPEWGNSNWMCARWFVKGKCFCDCANKESHVKASDIPTAKRTEFQAFLAKVRGEMTPTPTSLA